MKIVGGYYFPGGINADGKVETPHILDKQGGKVYFEIRCAKCHYGQCKEMTIATSPRRKQNLIFVEPCPRCLAAGEDVEVIELRGLPHDYGEME